MTMRGIHTVAALALASLLAVAGAVRASDVNVVQPPPAPETSAPTVIVAPGSTTVVMPSAPQMLKAEAIKADEVRASTIYANRIKAADIRGTIHQTKKVEVGGKQGDIKAPSVVASVIDAETIEARTVIAHEIFVREIDRK